MDALCEGGRFPYQALAKAVEQATSFYKMAQGTAVPVPAAVKLWGYTEKRSVGMKVQWTSNGVIQFDPPRVVTGLSNDGHFAFVEGNSTGLPVEELEVMEAETTRSATLPPNAVVTPHPVPQSGIRNLLERAICHPWPQ